MNYTLEKLKPLYPMTRSQHRRLRDSSTMLSIWKELCGVEDEYEYMSRFNGVELEVYAPTWVVNRHQPTPYQGRDMRYVKDEMFIIGDVEDGANKMFVIAKRDDWLFGFQFVPYRTMYGGDEITRFNRLEMNVVHV